MNEIAGRQHPSSAGDAWSKVSPFAYITSGPLSTTTSLITVPRRGSSSDNHVDTGSSFPNVWVLTTKSLSAFSCINEIVHSLDSLTEGCPPMNMKCDLHMTEFLSVSWQSLYQVAILPWNRSRKPTRWYAHQSKYAKVSIRDLSWSSTGNRLIAFYINRWVPTHTTTSESPWIVRWTARIHVVKTNNAKCIWQHIIGALWGQSRAHWGRTQFTAGIYDSETVDRARWPRAQGLNGRPASEDDRADQSLAHWRFSQLTPATITLFCAVHSRQLWWYVLILIWA